MLRLRPATPADALAVATVHVRGWQAGYRGLLADEYLDSLRAEERAARYTFGSSDPNVPETVLAEADGIVCGFAAIGASPEAGDGTGELFALYVDPPMWRHGIGTLLIADARGRMLARGFANAVLWVLDGNVRADSFYRADGWLRDDIARTVQIWGVTIRESRYHRRLP